MEKRASLGVRSKKPIKRNNKFLKKVVDYLKSDSYMFAPFLDFQPFDIRAPGVRDSANLGLIPTGCAVSPSGMKIKEPRMEEKKKLIEEVGEYLKSDSYLYAPLIDHQSSQDFGSEFTRSTPTASLCNPSKASPSVSNQRASREGNKVMEEAMNVEKQNQPFKLYSSKASMKHTVYRGIRSSSIREMPTSIDVGGISAST